MAALIQEKTGADVDTTVGERQEFSVVVGGETVAKRGMFGLPGDGRIVRAVRRALRRR